MPSLNYIRLINWLWEELPYIPGCKTSHLVLFLAIVDSINRNRWKETSIPYDYLITKCKISKETYLSGRAWLIKNKLLHVEIGKNAYQMAKFSLGLEVGKRTGNQDSNHADANREQIHLNCSGEGNKSASPTHLKTLNFNKNKTLNISFDKFWNLYDKKVGIENSLKEWQKLSDNERLVAMKHVSSYKQASPEAKYRKDPERYLKKKSFNDEIINYQNNGVREINILQPKSEFSFL